MDRPRRRARWRVAGAVNRAHRAVLACEAIGTRWEIETDGTLERALQRRILERIEQSDATYSVCNG